MERIRKQKRGGADSSEAGTDRYRAGFDPDWAWHSRSRLGVDQKRAVSGQGLVGFKPEAGKCRRNLGVFFQNPGWCQTESCDETGHQDIAL